MVSRSESLAIMGTSGSGKTTLLNILAGIDAADSGEVTVEGGVATSGVVSEEARTIDSKGRPGLVFQLHCLLPEFSAMENVAIAARIQGAPRAAAESRARALLDEVGLTSRAEHLPSELSGGESARVAMARALVTDPAVILADEPTGNLDEETSTTVQDLLFGLVARHARSLVIVTHDPGVAARAQRTLKLEHGVLKG